MLKVVAQIELEVETINSFINETELEEQPWEKLKFSK
jgi:hypothetical protein